MNGYEMNLAEYNTSELREFLRKRNVPTTGSEAKLVDRLAKSIGMDEMEDSDEDVEAITDDAAGGNEGLQEQIDELRHTMSDLFMTSKRQNDSADTATMCNVEGVNDGNIVVPGNMGAIIKYVREGFNNYEWKMAITA
uniref:SAP domain-containing protein n=1 Tax=Glossina austeni TaxID=7395 RepID=A0A1A9URD2_GLOAU